MGANRIGMLEPKIPPILIVVALAVLALGVTDAFVWQAVYHANLGREAEVWARIDANLHVSTVNICMIPVGMIIIGLFTGYKS